MLEMMNRYIHGYVAIPIIITCCEKGLFTLLQKKGPLSIVQLTEELSANEGHLQVALRMFESLQWISWDNKGLCELTMDAKTYQLIHSLPAKILSLYKIRSLELLNKLSYRKRFNYWLKYFLKSYAATNHIITDFLAGAIIIPFLIALKQNKSFDVNLLLSESVLGEELRPSVLYLFELKGWLTKQNEHIEFTPLGKFMLERAYNAATAVSYAPMLANMSEVLFGNPQKIFRRDAKEHECHIDRTLNVIASGFQHERYFSDIEMLIIAIFDNESYEEQPKYVIDMGCGDGSLLKRIYQVIATQTQRGQQLDQYPLFMIGVDYNQKALEATQKTLVNIPHRTLQGNIADPEQLVQDLKLLGITDPEDALHVRSFLDHDRPFLLPEQQAQIQRRAPIPYQGVYVDKSGKALSPAVVVQSLVEHLERWAAVISKYGIIILEVHNLLPKTIATYFDQNESFHFDALQAFSQRRSARSATPPA